ncbi:MAG TPA: response regulator [Bryobacteraceae bacterium]|nr:response regulator [Bryobacteraceae bacterium]
MKSLPITEAKILLVDENRDGLLVRRSLLEEHGFRVELAENGEVGLELFKSIRFDVVVTGYRIPRMSGTELIERIRKLDPHARVVLISGFAQPLGLTEENTGADVVLSKDSQEQVLLVRSVKRLLNRTVSRKPPRTAGAAVVRRVSRRVAAL